MVGVVAFAGIAYVVYVGSVAVSTVVRVIEAGGGPGPAVDGPRASCLSEEDVSLIVGSAVDHPSRGDLVGAVGCNYSSATPAEGVQVFIVSVPDLTADDQLRAFADEGARAGAVVRPIPVGARGQAWAGEYESAAIAVGDGRVVLVEIRSGKEGPIGDRTPAAIALLERVLG